MKLFIYMIKLSKLIENLNDEVSVNLSSNSVDSSLTVDNDVNGDKSNFVISNLTKQSLNIKIKVVNGVYFVDIK